MKFIQILLLTIGLIIAFQGKQLPLAIIFLSSSSILNIVSSSALQKQFKGSKVENQNIIDKVKALESSVTDLSNQRISLIEQVLSLKESAQTISEYSLNSDDTKSYLEKKIQDAISTGISNHKVLEKQIEELSLRIDTLKLLEQEYAQTLHLETNQFRIELQANINEQFNQLTQALKELSYDYTLIFDRLDSRAKLFEIIKKAKKRIIIVCLWPSYGIKLNNNEVAKEFKNFLNKYPDGIIDIGWGTLEDIMEYNNLREKESDIPETLEEYLKSLNYYKAVPLLIKLKQEFPDRFRTKIIGTHEKIVICDQQFAMLGSHNQFTSGDKEGVRETGICTDNPNIIDTLIKRFDTAKDWNLES
jgi:hypothetical protein